MTRTETAAAPARRAPAPRTGGQAWFAAVGVVFVMAQLVVVRPDMGLGWDETVYVSQVGAHAPAAYFSAPRARGVSVLVAPVASWSSSTPLLRVYLAVLSGAALYLALRVWRGLLPVRVLALGGALFASLWVTLFYGPQAMPNYWVAVGALTATGCFLHALRGRSGPAPLAAMAASAALMALMRPTDAVWATLPLFAVLVARRRWRMLAVLAAGLAAGAAEWVVEAYTSFGGPARRLSDASGIQGGLGWNNAVGDQLRSLGGRTLCRPCTGSMPDPAVTVWWFALPVLAAAGLAAAVRSRRTVTTAVPLACAASAAIPYLFLIDYAAPRFLLPAYALLAFPVADALFLLMTAPRGVWRPVAVTAVAAALAAHVAVQAGVAVRLAGSTTRGHERWAHIAAGLHRNGVRPPCVLSGQESEAPDQPIAYYAGCASADTGGHNANTTVAALTRTARRTPVAVLTTSPTDPPAYARTWRAVRLEARVYAYIAPSAGRTHHP